MFNRAIILIVMGFMMLTFGCSKKVVQSEGVIGEEISLSQEKGDDKTSSNDIAKSAEIKNEDKDIKKAGESKTDVEEGFPLREKFNKVKYITTEALNREYKKTIIVDVRSKIEFDVIHINKAVHIPIAATLFIKNLEKVREKSGSTPVVFYCNGRTCAKSYEAAEHAMNEGFLNVYAYDEGVSDWVRTHPEKTTLMRETPAPLEKLITPEMLAKRKISFAEFKKRAGSPDAIVVDARESFQRKIIPQIPQLRNIPSDKLVELIADGEFKENQLLILDAVGKQVEWIQYYLKQHGYANYYFLEKGVLSAEEAGRAISADEYVIGSEDALEVLVWRNEMLSRPRIVVRPDGKISLPLIGEVHAAGFTALQLKEEIEKRLKEYQELPTVTVIVSEINSYYIYILGEIAKPGRYQLKSNISVLQAVTLAGGFTNWASPDSMVVLRRNGEKEEKIKVRYKKIISGSRPEDNIILKPGDTIIIP